MLSKHKMWFGNPKKKHNILGNLPHQLQGSFLASRFQGVGDSRH